MPTAARTVCAENRILKAAFANAIAGVPRGGPARGLTIASYQKDGQ